MPLIASCCYFAAMTATNEAIFYASYPSATLAKSCKLIPTMFVGYFFEHHRYSTEEVLGVVLISVGIVVFNLSRIYSQQRDDSRDSPYGIFLLILSLVIDGFTNSFQSMLKNKSNKYRIPSTLETMYWTNLYALFLFFPAALISNQWVNGMALLQFDPNIVFILIQLNALAMLGQIFVFLTIQHFSPLMCTTITTIRKFFTILVSVYKFGHVFSKIQWYSIAMVFSGLFLEIREKKVKKA